jgi:ABC-2 type transport system ATP-binding protein
VLSDRPIASDAPVIVAQELCKVFAVERRAPGLGGALRALLRPQRELRLAVDRVSFTIYSGEIVGYLGPNGAGKSTTIKILTGILFPSSGRAWVRGLEPYRARRQNAAHIGAVFGQRTQLWWDLPAVESLRILKEIYAVPDAAFRARLGALDELLDLRGFWETPVRQLSLGQRMRCDLAAAMLHDPAVLYLDEPTIGMDVVAKERVRRFLAYLAQERRTTILLTTHDVRDVERLCRRVLLLDHGRVIYDGQLARLRALAGGGRTLHVRFAQAVPAPTLPGATIVANQPTWASFRFHAPANPRDLIVQLVQRYPVEDISIEEPDLEAVIRGVYEAGAVPAAGGGGVCP